MPDNVNYVQKSSRYVDAEVQCDPVEVVIQSSVTSSGEDKSGKELVSAVETTLNISSDVDSNPVPTLSKEQREKKKRGARSNIENEDRGGEAISISTTVDIASTGSGSGTGKESDHSERRVKDLESELDTLKSDLEKQATINLSLAAASEMNAKAQEELARAVSLLGETMPRSLFALKEEVERMSESVKTGENDGKKKGRFNW
jgi:hypothetical protein